MYLRNFFYSGHRIFKLNKSRWESHTDFPPSIVGDDNALPAIGNLLAPLPTICFTNPSMFVKLRKPIYYKTGIFRAHLYNWEAIASELIKAAKVIVLSVNKNINSVRKECDLIKKHNRSTDTIVVERREMNGVNLSKLSDVGHNINYLEFFKTEKIQLEDSETDIGAGEVTSRGKEILDKILKGHSTQHNGVNLNDLLKLRCFIMDRGFNDFPKHISPNSPGLFIGESKASLLDDWINLKELFFEANVEMDDLISRKALSKTEKEKNAKNIIMLALRYFIASLELEQYQEMCDALVIMVVRFPMAYHDISPIKDIVTYIRVFNEFTEEKSSADAILQILERMKNPGVFHAKYR